MRFLRRIYHFHQTQRFYSQKYPGTENGYASFTEWITVEDNTTFDYDIYMNRTGLRGFRFQASFDPDEKGTVLSMRHDRLGTYTTYVGYYLLYLSMIEYFLLATPDLYRCPNI